MARMGRPTKYTKELIAKANQYLKSWEELKQLIPSQAGLAVFLGVGLRTVEAWGADESKPDFLRVLAEIEAKQRSLLINRGLAGEFNSNIAKLVLSKHGFHDKMDNTLSGPGGGPINHAVGMTEELRQRLNDIYKKK